MRAIALLRAAPDGRTMSSSHRDERTYACYVNGSSCLLPPSEGIAYTAVFYQRGR
jgi:hypothetical protein